MDRETLITDATMSATTPTQPTTRPPNDEEPTPSAEARLWAALDAIFDPNAEDMSLPSQDGVVYWCRRCGYGRDFGRWYPRVLPPKTCANCSSSYWDKPAMTKRGRVPAHPSEEQLTRIRAEKAKMRRFYRRRDKMRAAAKAMGVKLDPAMLEPHPPTPSIPLAPPPLPPPPPAPAPELYTRRMDMGAGTTPLQRPRTVPPPPGIEELGGESR